MEPPSLIAMSSPKIRSGSSSEHFETGCSPRSFPAAPSCRKPLVFSKDDSHAEDVTRILREEFGKGNDFAQKITYRTGFIPFEREVKNNDGSITKVKDWKKVSELKPEDVLASFRNSYNPRIAVTVDMIATGTDVKPLECLLFMRNVKSYAYFEQMKGRGVRVIDLDALQSVTPDAAAKTHFVMVDAVGVAEQDKTCSKPLDRQPSVPLDKILGLVAAGVANPDLVSALASRLARLDRQLTTQERETVTDQAGGISIPDLTARLLGSLDPDAQTKQAEDVFGLTKDQEPSEVQLDQVQAEMMAAALKPLHDPKLRDLILNLKRSHEQVIDEITQDELLQASYDPQALEKAQALITNFKQFIEQNKDELEAIQILYTRPHRAGLRFKQVKDLAAAQESAARSDPGARVASLSGDGPASREGHGRKGCRGSHRTGAPRHRPTRADHFLFEHGAGALPAVA